MVKTLFAVAEYRAPSVVFVDEIDSMLTARKADESEASRRLKTEFLVQFDGAGNERKKQVLIVGATNLPQEIDDAARRRFAKKLYIPLPEQSSREALITTLLAKNNHTLSNSEVKKLSRDTDGFSGADLKNLCQQAAMGPVRKLGAKAMQIDINDLPPISYKHFRQALRGSNPSVAPADLKVYTDWNDTYGNKEVPACDDSDTEESVDDSTA